MTAWASLSLPSLLFSLALGGPCSIACCQAAQGQGLFFSLVPCSVPWAWDRACHVQCSGWSAERGTKQPRPHSRGSDRDLSHSQASIFAPQFFFSKLPVWLFLLLLSKALRALSSARLLVPAFSVAPITKPTARRPGLGWVCAVWGKLCREDWRCLICQPELCPGLGVQPTDPPGAPPTWHPQLQVPLESLARLLLSISISATYINVHPKHRPKTGRHFSAAAAA